jgi:hypothetical protein
MTHLKPVFGSEKNVKLIRRRVEIGENPNSVSGKKFELQLDYDAMFEAFKKMTEQIPAAPGILMVSGITPQGKLEFVKLIKGDFSLQTSFRNGSLKLRLNEFLTIMEQKKYRQLQVQLAIAS